jgi:hypothetical protein
MRWEHAMKPWLELGGGIELGYSGGRESQTRFALMPGVAFVHSLGAVTLRIEEQFGWQVVRGRLTLDAIPLRGTETRSFHEEAAVALDAALTPTIALRARAGIIVDGIFPVGHASVRAGPFVGVAVVILP